jgi:hypothetical protein
VRFTDNCETESKPRLSAHGSQSAQIVRKLTKWMGEAIQRCERVPLHQWRRLDGGPVCTRAGITGLGAATGEEATVTHE